MRPLPKTRSRRTPLEAGSDSRDTYQRRIPLLQHVVEAVGVVLAGRGGGRLLRILDIALSRSAVLAQPMRLPLPLLVTDRVLGVDDSALYGTEVDAQTAGGGIPVGAA